MIKEYFGEEKYEELKNNSNIIYKALEISSNLFKHDVDKSGVPYMTHLIYVYRHVNTEEEKVIALLHDIIEDKKVNKDELIDVGFSDKIASDVMVLTRIKPIEYKDYIDNIIKTGSKEALHVKLADLKHNLDISRIKNPTLNDYERVEKRYMPAYEKILNRLEEMK